MTTAHRPTWKSAFGLADSLNKGYTPTRSYSARDMPGYLKLKQRQWGQGSVDQLKQKDFKSELLRREAQAKIKKTGGSLQLQGSKDQKQIENIDIIENYEPAPKKKIKRPEQKPQQEYVLDLGPNPFPEDQDSQSFVNEQSQQKHHNVRAKEQEDLQDSSDDDDNSELLRQYQKIKEQREKEELFKREQKHQQSLKNKQRELLKGNPLIDSSYSLNKRWYQDTVFRNQATKMQQDKKTFVNDYVRSQFHRKFMHRFIGR